MARKLNDPLEAATARLCRGAASPGGVEAYVLPSTTKGVLGTRAKIAGSANRDTRPLLGSPQVTDMLWVSAWPMSFSVPTSSATPFSSTIDVTAKFVSVGATLFTRTEVWADDAPWSPSLMSRLIA